MIRCEKLSRSEITALSRWKTKYKVGSQLSQPNKKKQSLTLDKLKLKFLFTRRTFYFKFKLQADKQGCSARQNFVCVSSLSLCVSLFCYFLNGGLGFQISPALHTLCFLGETLYMKQTEQNTRTRDNKTSFIWYFCVMLLLICLGLHMLNT